MNFTYQTATAEIRCSRASRKIRETDKVTLDKTEGLDLLAVKNGYDSAQMTISASLDRRLQLEPDFVLSDLIGKNGEVYSAKNIKIFVEKYITVDRNWQKNGYPLGNYPDALLPLNSAKIYGEHLVEKGKQKTFYFEFFVPKKQTSGIYDGKIKVSADGDLEIPVHLEILGSEVSTVTKVRTFFTTNTHHMARYEGGYSQKTYDLYLDYLFEHKLCQSGIVLDPFEKDGLEKYCNRALTLFKRGYNSIAIPAYEEVIDGVKTFDASELKRFLKALVKTSVENDCNLVEKCIFYDWLIDEPFGGACKDGQVKNAIDLFNRTVDQTSNELAGDKLYQTSLGKEIISSVRKLPHLITDYYKRDYFIMPPLNDAEGNPYVYDMKCVLLCPKFDGYDTPELAAPYGENCERWWYGCNAPNSPFPGYHIDDAGFMPRIIGWMMSEHDIVGNLYWANNIYSEFNRTGKEYFLQDAYQTAHRGTGANGEGAILYPGLPFGIKGPVGCLRLKAIRDGHQDFDLFESAKDAYKKLGKSFSSIFAHTLNCLRDGTKVDSFSNQFEKAKESLYRLSEGVLIANVFITVERGENKLSFTASGNKDVTFTLDGKRLDGNQVTFSLEYQKDGWIQLIATSKGKDFVIPLYLGRGINVTLLETLYRQGKIKSGSVKLNTHEIYRKIEFSPNADGETTISLIHPVRKGADFSIELRSDGEEIVEISLGGQPFERVLLHNGWNRVFLSTEKLNESANSLLLKTNENGQIAIGDLFVNE